LGLAHLLTRGERESHCGCGPFVDLLLSTWSEQKELEIQNKTKFDVVMLQISQLKKKEKNLRYK
jgi:hypothetical protein